MPLTYLKSDKKKPELEMSKSPLHLRHSHAALAHVKAPFIALGKALLYLRFKRNSHLNTVISLWTWLPLLLHLCLFLYLSPPCPGAKSRTPHKSLKHFKHTWAALGTHSIPAPLCEIPRLIEEEECDPLTSGTRGGRGQYNMEQVNVCTFRWRIPQKCPT